MQQHPRWSLYKKVRRAAARELAAAKAAIAINKDVTEGDVDAYLHFHLKTIYHDLKRLYRFDSGCRKRGGLQDERSRVVAIDREET